MTELISPEILEALSTAEVEGKNLRLVVQLERSLYANYVNDLISRAGGVWNEKTKAHVFPEGINPAEVLQSLLNGVVPEVRRKIITAAELLKKAIASQESGDEYVGFCRSCGAQHDEIEPDVDDGECEECGELQVTGVEEIIIMYAF